MSLAFRLSFAGVPFVMDSAKVVRMPMRPHPGVPEDQSTPKKNQPLADLVEEVNRLIPLQYLQDSAPLSEYPGRNLGHLARKLNTQRTPPVTVRIGDWYYPNGACRWSVFRGLASSSEVKAMLAAVGAAGNLQYVGAQGSQGSQSPTVLGWLPQTFIMQATVVGAGNPADISDAAYKLESPMYMLPPRPLGETAGSLDGLYLVTLVDERYWWQFKPVSLRPTQDTTWDDLITGIEFVIDADVIHPPIPVEYGKPETDSQLWTNEENAAILFDAVAANIGTTVVRQLDGIINLLSTQESINLALLNRNGAPVRPVTRTAGGDMFQSGGSLPIGTNTLFLSRNAVVPKHVSVTFPKYVAGDDPVPHFLNGRYTNQRPSAWFEDSFGDAFTVDIPITSGGPNVSGVAGVFGVSHSVHSTAKALLNEEGDAAPLNASGLTALAMKVAGNYYDGQSLGLDEIYPGTVKWEPEGINDIVWTHSTRLRQACCRVMRSEWNAVVREYQHATPVGSGIIVHTTTGLSTVQRTTEARGVGGPSVAQTWRDSTATLGRANSLISGMPSTTLARPLNSGDLVAAFLSINFLPTNDRWRAVVQGDSGIATNEFVLFEGTSGGLLSGAFASGPQYSGMLANASGYLVQVAFRAVDGTAPDSHRSGRIVGERFPSTTYGVNLVTHERGQFVFPGAWTSGGIQEARIVPQTQTVQVEQVGNDAASLNPVPFYIDNVPHYPGQVLFYNPITSGSTVPAAPVFDTGERVWLVDRNAALQGNSASGFAFTQASGLGTIPVGWRGDGQFAGYSILASGNLSEQSGGARPVYLVNAPPPSFSGGRSALVRIDSNVPVTLGSPGIVGALGFPASVVYLASGGAASQFISGSFFQPAEYFGQTSVPSPLPPPPLSGSVLLASFDRHTLAGGNTVPVFVGDHYNLSVTGSGIVGDIQVSGLWNNINRLDFNNKRGLAVTPLSSGRVRVDGAPISIPVVSGGFNFTDPATGGDITSGSSFGMLMACNEQFIPSSIWVQQVFGIFGSGVGDLSPFGGLEAINFYGRGYWSLSGTMVTQFVDANQVFGSVGGGLFGFPQQKVLGPLLGASFVIPRPAPAAVLNYASGIGAMFAIGQEGPGLYAITGGGPTASPILTIVSGGLGMKAHVPIV